MSIDTDPVIFTLDIMKIVKIYLSFVLLFPLATHAQSLAYMDADTPSEAVGMMKATITVAGVLFKACSSRYPPLAQEMDENLGKWKAADANVIAKAEYYWATMLQKQPKLSEQTAYVESVSRKNFEAVAAAPGGAGA